MIKKRISILSILLAPICLGFFGLSARAAINDDKVYTALPEKYDGSMMPYDFLESSASFQLPDSLRPVHVEYVARHGSRYLSSRKKIEPLEATLLDARAHNYLTAEGIEFLRFLYMVEGTNNGHWGELSALGAREERRLADRMYHSLPQLALGGTRVNAVSSYMPRVVMTMYEFTHRLVEDCDSISVMTDEGMQYSHLLCCFTAVESYSKWRVQGDWRNVYDDFVRRNVPVLPARRMVSSPNISNAALREITMQMYEVLKSCRAAGLPAPTTEWMTAEEYHACWRASNLQHYLRNCVSPLNDEAARATSPLVMAIINSADAAIANPQSSVALQCWFGHAETLLPLLSALKIPGCYAMPANYDDLDKEWQIQEITPLGANLTIMLAQGPSGKIYAALQCNGHDVAPMPGHGEIVAWPELRKYWCSLIDSAR